MAEFELRRADALELLGSLPDGSVDLIVTDPPYSSLEEHRSHGTTRRLREWFPIIQNADFQPIFDELYRVLRDDAHCYVICDEPSVFDFRPMAERAGFKFWKTLVWDKMAMGMGYHYRAQTERVMFLEKGRRQLANLGVPDIIRAKRLRGDGVYPTEKPVELLTTLIEQSSDKGELVLDPFMGSGSTGRSALLVGRRFLGGDVEPRSLEMAGAAMNRIGTRGAVALRGQMPMRL